MHPGLLRILELIRANPQDTLLVDRFLILASDLQELDRVDATLGLSEALLRRNPRRAIELAHMVYKVRPGEPQSLELMVEGLENLGRYGKATVLRQQLEKVRKARETNPVRARDAMTESVRTVDQELRFLEREHEGSGNDESETAGDDIAANVDDHKGDVSAAPDEATPKATMTSSPIQLDLESTALIVVPKHSDRPRDGDAKPKNLKKSVVKSPQVKPARDFFDLTPSLLDAGVLEAASLVPKEPISKPVTDQPSPASAQSMRVGRAKPALQDGIPRIEDSDILGQDEMRAAQRQAARERLSGAKTFATGGRFDFSDETAAVMHFQRLIAEQNWEAARQVLMQQWPRGESVAVLKIFKEQSLFDIDVQFFEWWIDALIHDRRPRKALLEVRRSLQSHPHMLFAQRLYPKLLNLWALLKMRPIVWREQEGVMVLLRQLHKHKADTLASVAIVSPRA